jgi:endogenous inhibitor of DNA gyrase (YacG/DUF329 family)
MNTYECKNCGVEVKKGYTKVNVYCSNKCQAEYRSKTILEEWLNGTYYNKKGVPPDVAKTWVREQQGHACLHCSIKDWNGKPITFQYDHIDGNRDNNTPNNIRMLCPNCHSQTETYGMTSKSVLKMDYTNQYRRAHYKKNILP